MNARAQKKAAQRSRGADLGRAQGHPLGAGEAGGAGQGGHGCLWSRAGGRAEAGVRCRERGGHGGRRGNLSGQVTQQAHTTRACLGSSNGPGGRVPLHSCKQGQGRCQIVVQWLPLPGCAGGQRGKLCRPAGRAARLCCRSRRLQWHQGARRWGAGLPALHRLRLLALDGSNALAGLGKAGATALGAEESG